MSLRRVVLVGTLGDLFGREWNIHCTTPAQALSCIRLNRPDLDPYLMQADKDGLQFAAHIDDRNIGVDRFLAPFGESQTLYIAPALEAAGDGKGILTIVAGIALIAISVFTFGAGAAGAGGLLGTGIGAGGTAGFVSGLGASLILSGTAQLLTPTPELGDFDSGGSENKPSYLFDGPVNTTRQGNVRPLVYGEMMIGGQPISFGIRNEEWIDPGGADPGSASGTDGQSSPHAGDDASFQVNAKYGGYVGSGGGGGKSGGGGSGPREAPDSYRSISSVRLMDLLGEGEFAGPLDEFGNLQTSGEQLPLALHFNETPLVNSDGTYNFKNVKSWLLTGSPDQKHIPGFEGTEVEVPIGTEVKFEAPITSTITDSTVDAVRATLRLPTMYRRNPKNGNVDGTSVTIAWEISYDGGGFVRVLEETIRQKNTNPTLKSWRLDLNNFVTNAIVRMVRVSEDQPESNIQDRTFFEALTLIQDEKLNHPNTAKLGTDADASQFGGRIPRRAIRMGALMVRVPNNYDPLTKTNTGIWDFGFTVKYTNNPAWIFLDILTHKRYALGRWIETDHNDLASLYEIAQNSDELVTQGLARTLVLAAPLASGQTSVKVEPPKSWIETGQTLTAAGGAIVTSSKIRRSNVDAPVTGGTLIEGAKYRIMTLGTGAAADFVAAGALSNAVNLVFTATTTAPTWGTGGKVQPMFGTIPITASPINLAQGATLAYAGMEPRFECNLAINGERQAYKALQDLSSVFAGMTYWGSGLYKAIQDRPKDSKMQFTNANIIDTFKGTVSDQGARHTTAIVRYNDPDQFYKAVPIYVEDQQGVFEHGVRELALTAFGCTSPSQAMRAGKRALITERREIEGIEFEAGLEAHNLTIGDVVTTVDNTLQPPNVGGRLISVGPNSAELDREVEIQAGHEVSLVAGDGSGLIVRAVSNSTGPTQHLKWAAAISEAQMPGQNSVWMMTDPGGTEKKWRILNIAEKKAGFVLTCFAYDEDKYAEIEDLEQQETRTPIVSVTRVEPAQNLDVLTEKVVLESTVSRYATATWSPSPDVNVQSYVVTSRRDDGDWEPFRETYATNLRVPLDAPGIYEFQVQAQNGLGFRSGPVSTKFELTDDGLIVGETSPPLILPAGGVRSNDATSPVNLLIINDEGSESEVRYTWIHETEVADPDPLIVGNLYEILDNAGGSADFVTAGAADDNVGTVFTATGQPTWGSGGAKVRTIADADPTSTTTPHPITIYNPNWLLRSQEFTNAAWTKVAGTATNSTRERAPDGTLTVDFLRPTVGPTGRFEITQQVDISSVVYRGQRWVLSFYEAAQSTIPNFDKYTVEINDFATQPTPHKTVVDYSPSYTGLRRRQIIHQITDEQTDSLIIRISGENATNPLRAALFLWGAQLQAGSVASAYKVNTGAIGALVNDIPDGNTASIRARTFISDTIFSGLSTESYDSLQGQTQVGEPEIYPRGVAAYQGADFPLPITIKRNEPGSTIRYTIDGSDPATGTVYAGAFEIPEGTTVRAIATKGGLADSPERTETYKQGF